MHILIAGAGIFGLSTALELSERGHTVTVIAPGSIPHPLAASTDISKVVRPFYGSDPLYTALAEDSREGWLAWNEAWGEALYHDEGVLSLTRGPLEESPHDYNSYRLLLERGHRLERLDAVGIAERFPAFRPGFYSDGFITPGGGWVESGRVLERLTDQLRARGVDLQPGQTVSALIGDSGGRVSGLRTREGGAFQADQVVLAVGTWMGVLLPELEAVILSNGQPVYHLKPSDPALFRYPRLLTFAADISATGWYGFPWHPKAGVLKLANHGPGTRVHAEAGERVVSEGQIANLRAFLAEALPALADAPLVATRLCVYADTPDGDFWIDRHPERGDLIVASGGSGHAFKFGPALGRLIADRVEDQAHPALERFAWRSVAAVTRPSADSTRMLEES